MELQPIFVITIPLIFIVVVEEPILIVFANVEPVCIFVIPDLNEYVKILLQLVIC